MLTHELRDILGHLVVGDMPVVVRVDRDGVPKFYQVEKVWHGPMAVEIIVTENRQFTLSKEEVE